METFSWSGHKNAIFKKIAEFYINEIHTDCSFLVEGQYLRGHKTILCACSPFFEELFENESGKKTVTLKDVKFSDLKKVFDLIYFGVVEIPLTQVTSFINTSKLLQITRLGLTNTNNNERQAEITGSFPTSAYVEGNSPRIKSEVQEEENNDMTKHINASYEEFLIPDDSDVFSDVNENAVFLSGVDLKSENRNDQEFSLPDFNPGQQMDNPIQILGDNISNDLKEKRSKPLSQCSLGNNVESTTASDSKQNRKYLDNEEFKNKVKATLSNYIGKNCIIEEVLIRIRDNKKKGYATRVIIKGRQEIKVSEFLIGNFCKDNKISRFVLMTYDRKNGISCDFNENGVRCYKVQNGPPVVIAINWYVGEEKCTLTIKLGTESRLKIIKHCEGLTAENLAANKEVKINGKSLVEALLYNTI